MPREKEGFRDQFQDVSEYFKDKRLLKVADVAKYLKVDARTAKARCGIDPKKGITTVELARRLVS